MPQTVYITQIQQDRWAENPDIENLIFHLGPDYCTNVRACKKPWPVQNALVLGASSFYNTEVKVEGAKRGRICPECWRRHKREKGLPTGRQIHRST
jgi:hypothetical protein